MNCECTVETTPGRLRHGTGERLKRHRHACGFAAVVLSGNYEEAGDSGRLRVGPGDVIIHGAYESHLNRVARGGAEVLVVPWHQPIRSPLGKIENPDLIAQVAEMDLINASQLLACKLVVSHVAALDWPDELAHAIRKNPDLRITEWADHAGLRPESVSRGFKKAYGISPASYRRTLRALQALEGIREGLSPARVAADYGFADQPHLTRSIRSLTGHAPMQWAGRRLRATE